LEKYFFCFLFLFLVLDSWGKPPSRILFGNLQWLGAYDECTTIKDMKFCRSTFLLGGNKLVKI